MSEDKPLYVMLKRDSQLPLFMVYPKFLMTTELSDMEKLVYVLLLDRARLSMVTDGWEDHMGRIYIYYTIEDLAKACQRSTTTIKTALNTLENQGLILRKRQGFGRPNKIFVLIEPKNCLSGEQVDSPQKARKLAPNNNYRCKKTIINNYDYDEGDSL